MGDEFSIPWEIYTIVTSEIVGMATFLELTTVCSVPDMYDMLEIIEVKHEFDEIARLRQKQQTEQ